jgi:trypsin-like peptidase/tetratricopeptide repeat protein
MKARTSPLLSRRDACRLAAACAFGATGLARAQAGDPLDTARRTLERGDAATAVELYESLTRQGESLEAELGLVKAELRAGRFRSAVSWATLTAGEHPDSAEAAALLAYITDRAARTELALAALAKTQTAHADNWIPVAARAEILIDRLAPDQAITLIESWLTQSSRAEAEPELSRLLRRARISAGDAAGTPDGAAAPQSRLNSWVAAGFEPFPLADASTTAAGNGVVVDAGQTVLTYAAALAGAKQCFVRNGLGEVRGAQLEPSRAGDAPLVRLRLDAPYRAEWSIASDGIGAPDGVRFCFALTFGAPHSGDAAYPAMTAGNVVHADTGIGGLLQITSRLGRGHNGAPVFDARGRLIGLGLASGDHTIAGRNVRAELGLGALALRVDRAPGAEAAVARTAAPAQPAPPIPPVEELYERLSPAVVQVIARA